MSNRNRVRFNVTQAKTHAALARFAQRALSILRTEWVGEFCWEILSLMQLVAWLRTELTHFVFLLFVAKQSPQAKVDEEQQQTTHSVIVPLNEGIINNGNCSLSAILWKALFVHSFSRNGAILSCLQQTNFISNLRKRERERELKCSVYVVLAKVCVEMLKASHLLRNCVENIWVYLDSIEDARNARRRRRNAQLCSIFFWLFKFNVI